MFKLRLKIMNIEKKEEILRIVYDYIVIFYFCLKLNLNNRKKHQKKKKLIRVLLNIYNCILF